MDLKSRIRQVLTERQKVRVGIEGHTEAAVLLPIYKGPQEHHILFTKRTEALEKHKGQISFPGGVRHEEDGSLLDTALRESCEEIGLKPGDVEILGELDEIRTPTTLYHITPFVGMIPHPYEFKINRSEVEEIIEVPVSVLRDPRNYWEETRIYAGKSWPISHYRYGDRVIWGATARILKDFLALVFGEVPPLSTSQYRTG